MYKGAMYRCPKYGEQNGAMCIIICAKRCYVAHSPFLYLTYQYVDCEMLHADSNQPNVDCEMLHANSNKPNVDSEILHADSNQPNVDCEMLHADSNQPNVDCEMLHANSNQPNTDNKTSQIGNTITVTMEKSPIEATYADIDSDTPLIEITTNVEILKTYRRSRFKKLVKKYRTGLRKKLQRST